MAILDYEIGGNDIRVDGSEAIGNIPNNRALIVNLLTAQEPVAPQAVTGLTTIGDVFKHFRPKVNIEFVREDGVAVEESLKFENVGDFGVSNITQQSEFLRDLEEKRDFYNSLVKQLHTNKGLQKVLEKSQSKRAFIEVLNALKLELEPFQVNTNS